MDFRLLATAIEGVIPWLQERPYVSVPLAFGLVFAGAWLSLALVRATVLPAIAAIARKSPNRWGDIVLRHATLDRLAYLVPLAVIYQSADLIQAIPPNASILLQRLALASTALVVVRSLSALLGALNEIYNLNPRAAARPIKGLLQVLDVVAHIGALIFAIAALLDRSPLILLSGLGAMSAIVMLVFRDSILSLVAGMQITRNDLIRIGDWIEMPEMNADGDVIEIALNTVTVQNWDKTLTIIPTHNFLGKSFKNWRGMQASGGRRIKRSLDIDLSTVRFLEEEDIQRLRKFAVLRPYFEEKRADIEAWRAQHPEALENPVNSRRLTNIGTFRAYVTRYLREHPMIAQDMTFLVRQLQPGEAGLPLEIYVFVNDVRWAVYESVQADIFDHLIAILPEFDLRLFQAPSGSDLRSMAQLAAGPRGEATAGALEGPARELQAGTKG